MTRIDKTIYGTHDMFDRAEALVNAAKALRGIGSLDDRALEMLYSAAKAERRERNHKETRVGVEVWGWDETDVRVTMKAGYAYLSVPLTEVDGKTPSQLADMLFAANTDLTLKQAEDFREPVEKAIEKALADYEAQ